MNRSIATIFAVLAAGISFAQIKQAQRTVTVRAGTLIIESDQVSGYPANRAPHVWFNLDSNRRMKPSGFTLTNPARQTSFTADVVARWTALGGPAPAVGAQVTKKDAPYWEVRLSTTSDAQLSKYDVLLLAAHNVVSLNPLEREKLRRFIDKGGILWVDITNGASVDYINNLPLPFDVTGSGAVGYNFTADYSHPLLSFPGQVTTADIAVMESGSPGVGARAVNLSDRGYAVHFDMHMPLYADFFKLQTVVNHQAVGPTLMAGKIGQGYQVVTTRGLANTINRIPTGGGYNANTGTFGANPRSDRSGDAAAKLVFNMLHLTAAYSEQGAGNRHSNSSPIDTGAPLLQTFSTGDNMNGDRETPPVLYKGLVVVTTDTAIRVYDADPSSDLDSDGNPDDGFTDYATGGNEDLLWTVDGLSGPISPATCAEIPDAQNAVYRDQILVVDSAGSVHQYPAFQLDANGVIWGDQPTVVGNTINPPATGGPASYDTGAPFPGPYAVTVQEGIGFVTDEQDVGGTKSGRVWLADLTSGLNVNSNNGSLMGWSVGGNGTQIIPSVSNSCSVAYIPIQDGSGGLDKVVYVPTRPNSTFSGPSGTAGVTSLWLGARGERPTNAIENGGALEVTTRASGQGLELYMGEGAGELQALGPKLTILDATGTPMPIATMDTYFQGTYNQVSPGILRFDLKGSLPAGFSVRIDYHIDWGSGVPSVTAQILRGQLQFPDDTTKERRILGNVAVSPAGTIHVVHGTGDYTKPGGSFYSIREEGRGTFKIVNRFELYNQHTISVNQGDASEGVTYRETFINTDPVATTLLPAVLGGTMNNQTFSGGPAVQGDVVYVPARAVRSFFGVDIPFTILMAFKSEPESFEIRTGDLGTNFAIVQPDIARSSNKSVPELTSTLQQNQFTFERQPGSDQGSVRFDSLSATTRGPIINSLSTSQPVIIRRAGQPDLFIDPGTAGSRWSPLLWYTVFSGFGNSSAPMITGNTVFLAGFSYLPDAISKPPPPQPKGMIFGMDAQIPANNPFLVDDPARPWQQQLHQVRGTSFTTLEPNEAIRWPQFRGVSGMDDFRVRVMQTTLGTSQDAFGVVAGNNTLFSWSEQGVFGFKRADFIVADEGRLARFDPAGNPLWTSDASFTTGAQDVGAAGTVKPLVRPTRAYPINDREMIVVDTGGDRISRMDLSGRESRSIDGFQLDSNFTPEGFEPGESTKLRQPRDVLVFTSVVPQAQNRFSNPATSEFWVHYYIADTGNRRLLDIVDRYIYDPSTRQLGAAIDGGTGVLLRHSPAALSGSRYSYNSLARVWSTSASKYVIAAGIGNATPTRASSGLDAPTAGAQREEEGGNGGIVLIDDETHNVISVVNRIRVPAVPANKLWNETASSFTAPARPAYEKTLGNLESITMQNSTGGAGYTIMVSDGSGVYEIQEAGGTWDVVWMMPREAYRVMRRDGSGVPTESNPLDFRPTYARRLNPRTVLVVNGYTGMYRRNVTTQPWREFTGEVLELEGSIDSSGTADEGFNVNKQNLGFSSLSIRFLLPPINGARGLIAPVYADRR